MTDWYTSDEHFYHKNILQYCNRPFKDLPQMHSEIIDRHNFVVGSGDRVFHLGDFSLGGTELEQKLILSQLNGTHFILPGNHDRGRESLARIGFSVLTIPGQYSTSWRLADKWVTASHYPYWNPMAEDQRYEKRRPRDEDGWLIHGHVHELWKVKEKQINVGVDVWEFFPVCEEQLLAIING